MWFLLVIVTKYKKMVFRKYFLKQSIPLQRRVVNHFFEKIAVLVKIAKYSGHFCEL